MNKTFVVKGMKCEHCKARVENALNGLCGVNDAEASIAQQNVNIDFDENKVTEKKLKEAVDEAGNYELVL